MGLLDKALILDKEEEVFSPHIEKMMCSLQLASAGIEFPSLLFSHIIKELKITKGALLLPQEKSAFVPWAEIGFDRTTSRRIRIPESIINTIKNSNSYKIITLKDSQIDLLKEFFSFREYSVTEQVIIIPFMARKEIIAFLLISEGEILQQQTEYIQKIFEQVSFSAGPLLYSKRENIFNKLKSISGNENDIDNSVNGFIQSNKSSEFFLLSVSIGEMIELISNKDTNAISFRIKQDIFRLIKTLLAENGEVIFGNNNSIIILTKAAEAEMIIHQIGLSLNHFYQISTSDFKPKYLVKKYPDDGQTAEELTLNLL